MHVVDTLPTTSYTNSHRSTPGHTTSAAPTQSDTELAAVQLQNTEPDQSHTSNGGGITQSVPQQQQQQVSGATYPQVEMGPQQQAASGNEEPIDFPDFPLTAPGNGVDRSNFDKVVNGIVTSPDFSKHHPPLPDLPMQGKQQSVSAATAHSDENGKVTSANRIKNQPAAAASQNKASVPKQTANLPPPATAPAAPASSEQDSLFSGADSVNLTSLFEKGLNESSRIAADCLECICDASSNCDTTVQCISKQREKNRCGLYMISWNQFQESDVSLINPAAATGSGGGEDDDEKFYHECATDRNCAEKLMHLYIEKYQKDCNNDGRFDCYDIAAIHRVGPDNCNSGKFLSSQYWKDFKICYATERTTTTVSNAPQ